MRLSIKGAYGSSLANVEGWLRDYCALAVLAFVISFAFPTLAAAQAKLVKLVAFGDSLSAGYNLSADQAFPAKLQKALLARGYKVDTLNASVSGDTTSAGLARLDWSIPDGTDAVILELGANDALRGIDPAVPRKALAAILARLQERKIAVLLCGMLAPPNYGEDYATKFNAIYPDLAREFDVPLYPFFLDGVVADPKLNQGDGIHPTAAGVDVIVERILPSVEALMTKVGGARE